MTKSTTQAETGETMSDMTSPTRNSPHGKWQAAAVVAVIATVAVLLAGYAAAASYESVSELALRHHVPLWWLNPLSLDGGLFGFVLIDIVLTWTRRSLWWLRLLARLFAAGTIAANAVAGWPDPVGASLRIGAPVMFAVLAEVARAVLAHREREENPTGPERIPRARWLLAPASTFTLWRRMKLWRIRDYKVAVDMEIRRLQAIEKLRVKHHGKDWRQQSPGDLVWMLERGVRMREALERVAELTKPEPERVQPEVQGTRSGRNNRSRSGTNKRGKQAARSPQQQVPRDVDTQAEALLILAREPGISGGELGRRLGKSERYGCILKNRLADAVPGPNGNGGQR